MGLVCPLGRCFLCYPIRTLTLSRWFPREPTPTPVILVLPPHVDYPIPTVLLHLHPIPRRLLRVRACQENAWSWEGSGFQSDKRDGPARRNFQGRGMEPRLWRFSCLASSPRFEALARPQKTLGLPQIQLGLPGMILVPACHPRVVGSPSSILLLVPQSESAPCRPEPAAGSLAPTLLVAVGLVDPCWFSMLLHTPQNLTRS